MRVKLQVRWAGVIAGLIVAMAAIVASSLLFNFKTASHHLTEINEQAISRELMDQMVVQGKELSHLLSVKLTNPLYYYNLHNLKQQLSLIQELPNVSQVYVFDTQGRMVYDGLETIAEFEDTTLSPSHLSKVLAGHYVEQRMPNQQNLFIQPIFIGDKVIGGVNLLLSFSQTQKNISEMKRLSRIAETENIARFSRYSLFITLCLAVVGATLAIIIARRHTQPIHRLVQFSQTIGSENYCGPTCVDRDDELGDLSQALNQMASNLQQRTQQIEYLAYYDSLTELPNRGLFTKMLDKAIAKTQQHLLAVFCIDLDSFKRINDTLGHETGNNLIKAVSQRIHNNLNQSVYFTNRSQENNEWLLARTDGDEFALFVQGIHTTSEAASVAHCIMNALASTFQQDEHELTVSASIGIATYPDNGKDTASLLRNADIAMYRVKAEGKHDYKFFSQAMDASADHKMSLESDLRNALIQNELDLKYQPIVQTQSGKIIGAEALIRWQSTRHGLVPPSEFIPIAEECGLIHEIGQWIVVTALAQLVQWNKNFDPDFHLSINISVAQLQKNNLATFFLEEISELGINPKNIHLEVTETSLIFNKQTSITMLRSLKNIGIKVWLDDFGTGYSSLSHLKLFKVDGVKVDQSFVSDLVDNEEDRALTFAIIAMAKALGLNVIAEGVETIAQWHLLSQHHELYIQGYLISEALISNEFENLAFKQDKVYNLGIADTIN